MTYIKVGKIASPHALKGEIKIISQFDKKEKAFEIGAKLYIGKDKQALTCQGWRIHKKYDMIKFLEINRYEEASLLKGKDVFTIREELSLDEDEYLIDDLVGMTLKVDNKAVGKISSIEDSGMGNILLKVDGEKAFYYPYKKELVEYVSLDKREIQMEKIEGLL